MQTSSKRANVARMVALLLPPVALSLIGLAALSRRTDKPVAQAVKRPAARAATNQQGARG